MKGKIRRLGTLFLLILPLLPAPAWSAAAFTPSPRPAPTGPGLRAAPPDVVINEIAWMGTAYDANDEWIELYNNTDTPIDLTGWTLQAADGTPGITLAGTMPAHDYFLLERTDDSTIPDIPADQIYTGALGNTGEVLALRDAASNVVDTANGDGGGWPAGNNTTKQTMERIDPLAPDSDADWGTNTTWIRNGHDNGGNALNGTPKARNSLSWPDLAITKQSPVGAPIGGELTYEIAIVNQGPLAAPDVRITDTLPAGFIYSAYAGPYPCTQAGYTFSCQAGTIGPAEQGQMTITGSVALTASGTLLNLVQVTTAITEVTGTNNLAQATTSVHEAYPDLVAAKNAPATVHPGDAITYTLAISNIGPLAAPEVRISDTLPAGVAFTSQDSPYTFTRPAPGTLVWDLGTLDPGGQAAFSVYGQVEAGASGTLTNRLTAATTAVEPNLSNNSAEWSTLVLLPSTGRVVLNEVAWAGTAASASDEWMELYNASPYEIDLAGWTLSDGGDISITLSGILPAGGYFLLERSDDSTVSDIPADLIYTGGLNNGPPGEILTLRDATGAIVDTANGDGGAWPAGSGSPNYQSMERIDPPAPDTDANWASNDMVHRNGLDANGNPINGTPRHLNSPRRRPDLAAEKSGPPTVTVGMPITYSLVVQNLGTEPAADVRLTDTLPGGVDFVSQSSAFPFAFSQAAPGVLVWTADALPTATTAAITVRGEVSTQALPRLRNTLAASTSAAETDYDNNIASWDTDVLGAPSRVYLPLVFQRYYRRVVIEAVLYDGYQSGDLDEAVRLLNVGTVDVDLGGWDLCKDTTGGLSCKALPAVVLPAGTGIWVTRDAAAFERSFGFPPDYQMASWLSNGLANTGDEVFLRESERIVDGIVFGDSLYSGSGWSGPAVYPYRGSGNFAQEGQILQRILDETTARPVPDTDTAADWLQYPADSERGRRVLYPGWDLEAFFQPLQTTAAASLTVGIAPDNAAAVMLAAIGRAQHTIEAEFYEFEHWGIAQALKAKAAQGITITLLLEGEPAGGMSNQELWLCKELHEAGGQCYFMFNDTTTTPTLPIFDRYTNLHSKVMLIDRQWVLISSQNPTGGGLPDDDKSDGTWGSRGVLLLTDAPGVVARVAAIFDADMDPAHHNDLALLGTHGYDPPIYFVPITSTGGTTSTVNFPLPLAVSGTFGFEVLSAPESSLRRSDSLLGLIDRAGPGDTIEVEQMYEYPSWGELPDTSPAPNLRLAAYIAAARRGARVRILLNSGTFSAGYLDISKSAETLFYVNNLAYCEGLDLQARLGNPTGYGIHSKMVLACMAGQGYAHIGSINGSETSSKVNREIAVNVGSNEVYNYLVSMFDWDWERSGHLLLSEVLYNPDGDDAGKEWVELFNPTDQPIDLAGWTLGDALNIGEYGSGRYYFPAGTVIPPHSLLTVAQLAQMAGFRPDFEFVTNPALDNPAVPNMVKVANWEGFGFALGNTGDRVLLLDSSGAAVDAIVYGDATYPGVTPHPGVAAGHSLERQPPERDTDTCSADLADTQLPTPGAFPEGYYKCD